MESIDLKFRKSDDLYVDPHHLYLSIRENRTAFWKAIRDAIKLYNQTFNKILSVRSMNDLYQWSPSVKNYAEIMEFLHFFKNKLTINVTFSFVSSNVHKVLLDTSWESQSEQDWYEIDMLNKFINVVKEYIIKLEKDNDYIKRLEVEKKKESERLKSEKILTDIEWSKKHKRIQLVNRLKSSTKDQLTKVLRVIQNNTRYTHYAEIWNSKKIIQEKLKDIENGIFRVDQIITQLYWGYSLNKKKILPVIKGYLEGVSDSIPDEILKVIAEKLITLQLNIDFIYKNDSEK